MASNLDGSTWPDGALALLRKWHGEGLSMGEMSRDLAKSGHHFTRNAVIGKCHRLKLERRGSVSKGGGKRKPRVQQQAAPKPRKSRAGQYKPKVRPREVPPPEALMIPLLELGMRSCRWPIGHPGEPCFGFCGANNFNGMSYCEHHSALAYVPVTSRAEREAKRQAVAA